MNPRRSAPPHPIHAVVIGAMVSPACRPSSTCRCEPATGPCDIRTTHGGETADRRRAAGHDGTATLAPPGVPTRGFRTSERPRLPSSRTEAKSDDPVMVEKAMTDRCPIDGNALTRPATGRPPLYCSVACRRVAEAELRRLDRRLASLEAERDRIALDGVTYNYPSADMNRRRLAAIETAIAGATERQRQLYAQLSQHPEGDDAP